MPYYATLEIIDWDPVKNDMIGMVLLPLSECAGQHTRTLRQFPIGAGSIPNLLIDSFVTQCVLMAFI